MTCFLHKWAFYKHFTNEKSLCLPARRPIRPALISGFISMKQLGVFLLPPGWDASPSQGYPQHFAGTHLYTWVERGTVGVKYLAQKHNTMSPARIRTWTTRSGVERANHEATAPPTYEKSGYFNYKRSPKITHYCVKPLCLQTFQHRP